LLQGDGGRQTRLDGASFASQLPYLVEVILWALGEVAGAQAQAQTGFRHRGRPKSEQVGISNDERPSSLV
jgi:hypothetical protein